MTLPCLLIPYLIALSLLVSHVFSVKKVCQITACRTGGSKTSQACYFQECGRIPASSLHKPAVHPFITGIRLHHTTSTAESSSNTSLILTVVPSAADTPSTNWSYLLIEVKSPRIKEPDCIRLNRHGIVATKKSVVVYNCLLASPLATLLKVRISSSPFVTSGQYLVTYNRISSSSTARSAVPSWRGAIAASLNIKTGSLYVVYETVTTSASYSVTLHRAGGSSSRLSRVQTIYNNVTFPLPSSGKYFVAVSVISCSGCGRRNATRSGIISYTRPDSERTTAAASTTTQRKTSMSLGDFDPVIKRVHSDHEDAVKLILGTIFGVLTSLVIMLSVICFCRRHRAQRNADHIGNGSTNGDLKDSPAVFLLYSYDSPHHVRVVEALSDYLVNVFNCIVYLDVFEHDAIKEIGIENWLHECLQQSNFIIAVSSIGARIKCSTGKIQFKNDRVLPDYFATAVELVSEQMKIERSKELPLNRYIVVYPKYSKASDIPVQMELASRFKLTSEVIRLYQHMFEINSDASKLTHSILANGSNYWMQLLERAIDDADAFFSNSDWLDSRTIKSQPVPSIRSLKKSKKIKDKIERALLPTQRENRSITINLNVNLNVEDRNTSPGRKDDDRNKINPPGIASDVPQALRGDSPQKEIGGMRPADIPLKSLKRVMPAPSSSVAKETTTDTLQADVHNEWIQSESTPSLSSGVSESTDGQLEKDIRDIRDFPSNLDHVINVHLKISNFLDRSPTYDIELNPKG